MKNYTTPILILFLFLVIAIIGNITISAIGLFFNHDVFNTGVYANGYEASLNIKLIFMAKAFALLMFIYSVYILIRNLKFLVRRDFFNNKLVQCFSKSGKLFFFSGIVGFLASICGILNIAIIKDFGSQAYLNIDSKSLYIMLMILGFFLLLFSKVLDKGNEIQQENDLTI
ncbi:DUF2975 domain-containing protein [Winogradskyella haliclonae]|uniref:DUF2975 domain-containing protein n=1 Tax=Winogradskyella haliclonae TaxID=2048558 RepID=A0ABQ2BY57_9FLAO|nr:DUF2975 domain-containing protein [Winogradskyella haliclonae]GGI56487.1 hypothetical protein GCM10011444_07960 [Winogradskyella haliclonae]